MATGQFDSWAFVWTFLGFMLILAGTSIDEWTATDTTTTVMSDSAFVTLPLESNTREPLPLTRRADYSAEAFIFGLRYLPRKYGTLAVEFDFSYGYSYSVVCDEDPDTDDNKDKKQDGEEKHSKNHPQEMSHRTRQLNRVSAGMIAMLILTNVVCFVASFQAFLGATGSSIGGDFASARTWAIGGFVSTVVTWALWLRAYQQYLNQKNHCRFEGLEGLDVVLGGSFGLFIVATALYLVLIVVLTKGQSPLVVSVVALAGFSAVFVGSIYNSWSRAGSPTSSRELQTIIDDTLGGTHSIVTYNQAYGVYTAIQDVTMSFSYTDGDNRNATCWFDVNSDGASEAIVKGGQVTLGVAITATILSFFAAVLQYKRFKFGFWLSVMAVCCVAVALIVWSSTANYILTSRCCEVGACKLSTSYGLLASGAGMLVIAIFYQAWVLKDEFFVLPAHAYGMASQFESELQIVQ